MDNSVRIHIHQIPDLIRDLLTVSLPADYQAFRPIQFTKDSFTRVFLCQKELDRLNEFKALKKQVEWLCGRYSAKTLAKSQLMPGQPEREIDIAYMDEGAPYLARFPRHCLSLSHSGIYTAAALSAAPGITLGIDLEKIGRRPGEAFIKTAFTGKERRAMGTSTHDLYTSWTLKEAYLKYIRKGFNENLHRVEIIGNDIFHNGIKQHLDCRTWELDGGYLLSGVFPVGTQIRF